MIGATAGAFPLTVSRASGGRPGMRIAVGFGDESLDFEVADDRVVGRWEGPAAPPLDDLAKAVRAALEEPIGFPPLELAAVPGDRVVIPFDGDPVDARRVLGPVAEILRRVEVGSITVVSMAAPPKDLPDGLDWKVHDPDDRAEVAYLASTQDGQRVYLNRLATDADLVLPIGVLGPDPGVGHRGPWSALYPGLSDRATQSRYRALVAPTPASAAAPESEGPKPGLEEVSEVAWLLGSQLQVGLLPGRSGIARVVAGLDAPLRAEAIEAIDGSWAFRVEERADLVVAGVGQAGKPTTIEDLAEGLANAAALVRRGGKIVALAPASGPLGPAVKRLAGAENPRAAANRLRGHEADPDYSAARKLAAAIAWADVYLYSGLDRDLVDDLAMVPLDRPEEARKLAGAAASCTFLSLADRTRVILAND